MVITCTSKGLLLVVKVALMLELKLHDIATCRTNYMQSFKLAMRTSKIQIEWITYGTYVKIECILFNLVSWN